MRTWLYEEDAVAVPLLRICQLTYSEPPGATLLEPGVTFNGCTSTVANKVCWLNNNPKPNTTMRKYLTTTFRIVFTVLFGLDFDDSFSSSNFHAGTVTLAGWLQRPT